MMTRVHATDGHELDCWMEAAQGQARFGLVIVQEIFGVTDQLRDVARAYAAQGCDVAIPALFDRQEPGVSIPFDQPERGRTLMQAAKLEETMRDIATAVDALKARGHKVAVLGFCWGGGLALRAAQTLDIACAVAFYGTRLAQYLDRPLRAPLLAHFGTRDDHTPPELVEQVQAYLPEMEVHFYEAGHAFANEARATYVPEAATLAHERTRAFLRQHIG
ncbi:dienelactone hydrolase family protein [Halovulum dunhuangense]|uniref:Dienelactone hydrolase family protein n=1 Tax=Halovulum dunhuangense TaxID=1505036 RepID=A0A849L0X8_9RHOB|nr:dienelactone hydrolase family protein [Halovulum dunhuangense]NNU79879.1 dienelactone hydrolase family protein [Halovulum dunhuangense]